MDKNEEFSHPCESARANTNVAVLYRGSILTVFAAPMVSSSVAKS
jgi:hypothetical protein